MLLACLALLGSVLQEEAPLAPAVDCVGSFGRALAALDDLDGDGVQEIAIGAPYEHRHKAQASVGAGFVCISSGKDLAVLARRRGERPHDNLGASLAQVCDLDGDGVRDLAAGAPTRTATSENRHGAVYVLSGRSLDVIRVVAGDKQGDTLGEKLLHLAHAANESCRVAASGIGSVREVDLVHGRTSTWGFFEFGPVVLSLLVWPGDKAAISKGLVMAIGNAGAIYLPGHINPASLPSTPFLASPGGRASNFGASMCSVPDCDGDGVTEVAVSDQGGWSGGGDRVLLFSGRSTKLLREPLIPTSAEHWELGRSLATCGDWNRDGTIDLAVGSKDRKGGLITIFSGTKWEPIGTLRSPDNLNSFGESIVLLADESGAAVRLAVGSSDSNDTTGRREGRVDLFQIGSQASVASIAECKAHD